MSFINHKKLELIRVLILVLFLSPAMLFAQEESITKMLGEFVESYKNDPMAHTTDFGIKIGDQWWSVKSTRVQEGYAVGKNNQYTSHNYGPHEVSLKEGKPEKPTWYFEFANPEVFKNIYNRKWTASTASAKTYGSDVVGLESRNMDGFSGGIKSDALIYEVMEHFWKRDPIEITYFTRDSSLPTHGVDHVGLYTMKDKRIGWFSIGPEEAANAGRGMDKGQAPNLFIITKGKGKADFGQGEVDLKPGMSIFVGPYVKHVLYNPYSQPLEGIVILYGDNIDFARGKSYMDFLEQQLDFYDSYDKSITAEKNNNNN